MPNFSELCRDGVKTAATYTGPNGAPMRFWDSVIANSADQLVGRPQEVFSEIHSGTAFAPESYTRRAIWPVAPAKPGQSFFGNLGRYVWPALYYGPGVASLVGATSEPEETRGTAVGDALGNLIGTAAGSPFGYLGSAIGSMVGAHAGRSVGHVFDRLPPRPAFPRNHGLTHQGQYDMPYDDDPSLRHFGR